MEIGKFLVSTITFVFIVLLFPTMTNAIADATITSNVGAVITVFPYVFLLISLLFVIFYGVKK